MKTKDSISHTGCNPNHHPVLAASRLFGNQGLPQRKKGSGRPRKVTNMVLKSLKRQIDKYLSMTAGQLRATVPEVATLSDRSVQHALQKDLKMPSKMAALTPLLTDKMKRKRLAFAKNTRTGLQFTGRGHIF
jgi:hypothetical protein